MSAEGESNTQKWILAHQDYPHEDWCLIWPFSRDPRLGRGMMGGKGQDKWAHRNMCTLIHGPAPADRPIAVHSCGNGHEGCVNPRHLSWSTYSDNQLHRYAGGRGNPNQNGNKSMFTPEQIADIRSKYGEFSQVKLAEMYGCSVGTIQYYLRIREERGHAGGKINHWSPDEDAALREAIERGENFTQAAASVGRPVKATTARAYRMGLRSGQPLSNGTR